MSDWVPPVAEKKRLRWLSRQYQQWERKKRRDRKWNVSVMAAMLGFGESATWTMFSLFPGTSSCAVAHYTVLEESPFILYSLLKFWGKGSQTQSLLFLVTNKLLLSLTPKAQIFLLRYLPRQAAQCGLTDPHVTSQDTTLYPETNQKPNHQHVYSCLQEETLFIMPLRLLKSLKCLFMY